MEIRTHKDLIVWQKSLDFVSVIYKITATFPQSELFALTNQIRRCSVSIPANIAEGSGRKNEKELIQFLHIALGSVTELDTLLIIANKLKYLTEETFLETTFLTEITKMLIGLINSLRRAK